MPEEKGNMHRVHRVSVTEPFLDTPNEPIPTVPKGGARVKVYFAGACYTEQQIMQSGRRRPKMAAIQDTSLYPGYEVSGVIDALCNTVDENKYKVGMKVIIYPEEDNMEQGYAEYVTVNDVNNLIKIPDGLSMKVAAMLPSGALTAISALYKAQPLIREMIKKNKGEKLVQIMVVGAGALGLWTTTLGKTLFEEQHKNVHVVVADHNIEKLMQAKEHGCADVIHWNEQIHEEYIIERTKCVCGGAGIDVILDYSSTPRTISRAVKMLAQDGLLVVGGNARYDIPFDLHSLAQKQQTVMGVSKGTREQLEELVTLTVEGKIKPPKYEIFPVEEANQVFDKLNDCKITGRPVLQVCSMDDEDLA